MKKILGILLALTMAISLLGCANPDTDLYNAMERMQDLSEIESETDLSFEIKGQGFEESEQMLVDQLSASLNNLKVRTKEKALTNKETSQVRSESVTSVEFGGMTINMKNWSDLNLDSGDMKNIVQLPAVLNGLMGPEVGKKDYLIYDMRKIMEAEDEKVNFDESIKLQKEFQTKILELTEKIQKELKADFKIIELKEEKERAGEKIKVYEFKLDDRTFKKLVKEFVNTNLENERTREFIVDYMNLAMKMAPANEFMEEEIKEMKDEILDIEGSLDENVEKLQKEFNEFMEKIQDIRILGEKGVNVEYLVNLDGYIVETNGIIDLTLDFEKLGKVREEIPANKGILDFKIKYNTKNKNINNQDMKVEFPEITKENSIDFLEIMEMQKGLTYGQ